MRHSLTIATAERIRSPEFSSNGFQIAPAGHGVGGAPCEPCENAPLVESTDLSRSRFNYLVPQSDLAVPGHRHLLSSSNTNHGRSLKMPVLSFRAGWATL